MLTPWEAHAARADCRAALAGAAAGVFVVGACQGLAALLRLIMWLQS